MQEQFDMPDNGDFDEAPEVLRDASAGDVVTPHDHFANIPLATPKNRRSSGRFSASQSLPSRDASKNLPAADGADQNVPDNGELELPPADEPMPDIEMPDFDDMDAQNNADEQEQAGDGDQDMPQTPLAQPGADDAAGVCMFALAHVTCAMYTLLATASFQLPAVHVRGTWH
jgi:hypothetical protein